jgi:aminopeptidase YwaD
MDDALRSIEQHVLGEVWTSGDMYRSLRKLCDEIGSRFGGTGSEHGGAVFLLGKMQDYGLRNPHLEKFPVYAWDRGPCELHLNYPLQRQVSAIAMPFCPSGTFVGEIIDLGEGEQAEFDANWEQIKGKVVLSAAETNQPGQVTLHRTDKVRLAIDAGAVAYIMVNKNPGLLHITGALYAQNPGGPHPADHESAIPVIGITHEAGGLMRRLFEDTFRPRVTISTQNVTRLSFSYNVVGDVPGGEHPEEVIVFGGHYDGHDIAQGAGDDAAGTLVGLEVGRVLAPFAGQLKRTLRIVCFAYEELGLGGAWKHVTNYGKNSAETLRFVMNLDGAGRGSGGQDRITTTGDPDLRAWFESLKPGLHYDFETMDRISAHSDHFPFFLEGFPTATLNSTDSTAGMIGRGYGHTEGDTVDKVSLRGLQMGAAFAARIALRLANADPFPVERRSKDAVRAALTASGQAHFLEHHWGRANRVEE